MRKGTHSPSWETHGFLLKLLDFAHKIPSRNGICNRTFTACTSQLLTYHCINRVNLLQDVTKGGVIWCYICHGVLHLIKKCVFIKERWFGTLRQFPYCSLWKISSFVRSDRSFQFIKKLQNDCKAMENGELHEQ